MEPGPAAFRLAVRELLATGRVRLALVVFRLARPPVLRPLAAVALRAGESVRLAFRLAVQDAWEICRVKLALVIFRLARAPVLCPLMAVAFRVWPAEFFLFLLALGLHRPTSVMIQVVEILCQDQAARRGRRRDAS